MDSERAKSSPTTIMSKKKKTTHLLIYHEVDSRTRARTAWWIGSWWPSCERGTWRSWGSGDGFCRPTPSLPTRRWGVSDRLHTNSPAVHESWRMLGSIYVALSCLIGCDCTRQMSTASRCQTTPLQCAVSKWRVSVMGQRKYLCVVCWEWWGGWIGIDSRLHPLIDMCHVFSAKCFHNWRQ